MKNHCNNCTDLTLLNFDELAAACSNCKGDHPHINAKIMETNQLIIKCPYCKNLHLHDEIGTYTCRDGLYTIKPAEVIAEIFSEYVLINCPLCHKPHYFDSIPINIFSPECNHGLLEIVDTIEKIYHSSQRIAKSRLEAI